MASTPVPLGTFAADQLPSSNRKGHPSPDVGRRNLAMNGLEIGQNYTAKMRAVRPIRDASDARGGLQGDRRLRIPARGRSQSADIRIVKDADLAAQDTGSVSALLFVAPGIFVRGQYLSGGNVSFRCLESIEPDGTTFWATANGKGAASTAAWDHLEGLVPKEYVLAHKFFELHKAHNAKQSKERADGKKTSKTKSSDVVDLTECDDESEIEIMDLVESDDD